MIPANNCCIGQHSNPGGSTSADNKGPLRKYRSPGTPQMPDPIPPIAGTQIFECFPVPKLEAPCGSDRLVERAAAPQPEAVAHPGRRVPPVPACKCYGEPT